MLRLALAAGGCALAGWLVWRKRIFLLSFYYFSFGFLTVVNDDSVPLLGGLKAYRFAYALLLLSVAIDLVKNPIVYERFRRWPNWSYLAVVATLILSSFYSPYAEILNSGDGGSIFSILVITLLFWVCAEQVQTVGDFTIFAWTTVGLSLCISAWVIWTVVQGEFAGFRGGTNINENYESLFVLAGTVPLTHFLLVSKGWRKRVVSTVALGVILLASFILASRGMLVAATAGIGATVVGLFWKQSPRKILLGAGVFALIVVCVLALPGADNIVQAFQATDVSTLDDRVVIWRYALQHFVATDGWRTFFGDGLSSARSVLDWSLPEYANYHNDYLMWLMERGVVGFVVFLIFLYHIAKILLKTGHPDKCIMQGWFVFLAVAGLTSTVSASEHLYWILLGVMAGAACGWPVVKIDSQTGAPPKTTAILRVVGST